jgi:4-hydroxy-tetrahydrodipicolinate reductase
MISVSILGASGRMGALTKELVDQDPNLKLHAALDSRSNPESMLGADVVVDFTRPDVSEKLVEFAINHDQKVLVGTSGWSELKLAKLERLLQSHSNAAVVVVPNFSVGSMLAQRFATEAAKFFPHAEIVEAHHAGKEDSPSGTAIRTAELISSARIEQPLVPGVDQEARGQIVAGIPIHSIRLDGVSARQETIFGADSEQLRINHDVISHRAYSLGILRAIEFTALATGINIGLEKVLN